MTTVEHEADVTELRQLIQKIARIIRGNRDTVLTDSQILVLVHIDLHGPQSPYQLADYERVSQPSMNRMLNILEKGGYLARSPYPGDSRRVLLTLTDLGREVANEEKRQRSVWFSERFAQLDPDEAQALRDALPALRHLLAL
jgi:DNA-binding MarR family transcriptional regulator